MQDFLKFNKMFAPVLIQIIFYVGSALSILMGFILMITGGIQVFMGLFVMVGGPFVIRIYCELFIVMFKIHESLQKISASFPNKGSLNNE